MNKKELFSFAALVICLFFIGFIFFSNATTEIKVQIKEDKLSTVKVPVMYSITQVVFLIFLAVFASFAGVYFFSDMSKKVKQSRKESTVINILEGDEKRLYEFVLVKKECLQKDIVYELQFSKAKVTRILDKLVNKGLLERVSYGNTNKVKVKN